MIAVLKGKSYATEATARKRLEAVAPVIGKATALVAVQDGRFVPVVILRAGEEQVCVLAHMGITVIN